MSELDDVATELRRIVDRLNSAPLTKVEPLVNRCHEVGTFIVERMRDVAADVPAGASLPRVGASAAGAQLAVVGHDYLAAARSNGDPSADLVLERLTALRRELP